MLVEDKDGKRKGTILLVDDEPDIVFFLKHFLEEHSYRVDTALCGHDALGILKRTFVNLLISDIQMPGMDGLALIGQAVRCQPDIQTIVLTGCGDVETAIATLKAGAISYLKKPINLRELLISVEKGLEKQKMSLDIKTKQQKLEEATKQLDHKVRLRTSELEKSNRELREALDNVKTLKGLLPICAACKKIRDDRGYWSQIETYITLHANTSFSHGICPDCARKMYPELYGSEILPDSMNKTVMVKVLIVDDEACMRKVMRTFMEKFGCDFALAKDGVEALDILERDSFDIVITDMVMPNMDGMTLLTNILKRFPEIAVLVMTGFSEEYSYADIIKAGAKDYLAKPFTYGVLQAKLQRLLNERKIINDLHIEITNRKLLELQLRQENELFHAVESEPPKEQAL